MSVESIIAPSINVNDTEMLVIEWMIQPWQFVEKGWVICRVETTKVVAEVETDHSGYIYPIVEEGRFVRVGEPLAYVFPKNDPTQLAQLKAPINSQEVAIISKKARRLMEQYGLTPADFADDSVISSEKVAAKIERLQFAKMTYDSAKLEAIMASLTVDETSIAIYGTGNQGIVVWDTLIANAKYTLTAFIDYDPCFETLAGLPVLSIESAHKLCERGLRNVHICVPTLEIEQQAEKEIAEIGLNVVSVVHSSAAISATASLGKGVFVGPQVIIGPYAVIGDFCRILNGATIAHHCELGRSVHISDGVHLAGSVKVDKGSLLGIGVNVNKKISIGKGVTVVSGVTVFNHVPEHSIVRKDGKAYPKSKGLEN